MASTRYKSEADLRNSAERAMGGPVTDTDWQTAFQHMCDFRGDSHLPYDDEDLADVRSALERLNRKPARRKTASAITTGVKQEAALVLRQLGVELGATVVLDALHATGRLAWLGRYSPGKDNGDVDSRSAPGERDYTALGRLMAMGVAARLVHKSWGISQAQAMTLLAGTEIADPVDWAARWVWRQGAHLGRGYDLYAADQAIRREIEAGQLLTILVKLGGDVTQEELSLIQRAPKLIIDRFKKPYLGGTWVQRWRQYEERHADRVGRSFLSADSYRVAVRRAEAELACLCEGHRRPSARPNRSRGN